MQSEDEIVIISIVAKRNSDSCYLNLGNGESLLLNLDIITNFFLSKGKKITQETLEILVKEQRKIEVRKAAYRFASYKPRSIFQIKQKLKEKGFSAEEAELATNFLKNFGLLNDMRFAENFIKNKAKTKNFGISRIKIELKRAGIADELIDQYLREFYPIENTMDLARAATNKKMKLLQNKPKEKQKNSLIQFLARQGFGWDIIKKIVAEIFNSDDYFNSDEHF